MTELFNTIIFKFKQEVGKSKQMTAREIKLTEICYQEMVGQGEQLVCDLCFNGTPKQTGNMFICPKCGEAVN